MNLSLIFSLILVLLIPARSFIKLNQIKYHGSSTSIRTPFLNKFNFYDRRNSEFIEFLRGLKAAVLEKKKKEAEAKRQLQLERENEIYREHLAKKIQSSILRDFITLRY